MSVPGGRGVDRAGVCQHQQINDGSPGGSPSQIGSPSRTGSTTPRIKGAEMSVPGERGVDRADVSEHQQIKDGSPGGSPSRKSTSMQSGSPIRTVSHSRNQNVREDGSPGGSPSQKSSLMQSSLPMQSGSRNQRISSSRQHVATNHASKIAKPPPLLDLISRRRHLEEYTLGEIFEPKLASATLDFAMIPKPTTFA